MNEYCSCENGGYEAADIHLSTGVQEPYIYGESEGDSVAFLCMVVFLIAAAVTLTVSSLIFDIPQKKKPSQPNIITFDFFRK